MATTAQHLFAGRPQRLSGFAMPSLMLEAAMAAKHQRSAPAGDSAGRGRAWRRASVLWRACAEPSSARRCASAARDHGDAAASEAARIKWMLTALQAHHRGLTLGAAMRDADRDAGSFVGGRQALAAFVDGLEADRGLPLAAQLRRLVLAELVAVLRRFGVGRFSSARR